MAGHDSSQGLVLQIATSVQEDGMHSDLPFGAVLEMLEHQQSGHADGLLNVAFIFGEPQIPAATANAVESSNAEHLMKCALVLRAREADDGLILDCEYD